MVGIVRGGPDDAQIEIVDLAAQRLDMAVWAGGDRLVFGNQKPRPSASAERNAGANVGADVDLADGRLRYDNKDPVPGLVDRLTYTLSREGGGDSVTGEVLILLTS